MSKNKVYKHLREVSRNQEQIINTLLAMQNQKMDGIEGKDILMTDSMSANLELQSQKAEEKKIK